ncbi:tyrosine-type recombinase/integrase [Ekhidna sp.]|uniref:tyrosine-type recombinase/integrase n=1 Tax=Ekhidna sp. TaxID=2608089 RepID=UPI003297155A
MTTNFYLHNKNSKTETIIFLHFRYPAGNLFIYSTRQKIKPSQWNFKKKRCKEVASNPSFSSINKLLSKIENEIKSIYLDMICTDITPSNDVLRQSLSDRLNFSYTPVKTPQKKSLSFLDYFNQYIEEAESQSRLKKNGHIIRKSTISQYKSLLNHLHSIRMIKKFEFRLPIISGMTDEQIREVDLYYKQFYKVFTDYHYNELNCYDYTVGSRVKTLRAFFNYLSTDKRLNIGSFHKSFRVPKEEIPVIVLSPKQLSYLIHDKGFIKSIPPSLSTIRDLFICGCTVALRISDLLSLTEDNVKRENDCVYLINKSKKTNTITRVKLPPYAVEIIDRNIQRMKSNNGQKTIFGRPRLNDLNQQFRNLAKYCRFNDPIIKTRYKRGQEIIIYKDEKTKEHFQLSDLITSHTMRRTAISTSLILGMPEHAVKELSGHSQNSRDFSKYVKISQKYLDEQMDVVTEKLKRV